MSTTKSDATDKMRKGIDTVMYGAPKASIELSAKDLPAIKDWKVGSTYTIELKVKQVSSHIDQYPEGADKNQYARFEVISAKAATYKEDTKNG